MPLALQEQTHMVFVLYLFATALCKSQLGLQSDPSSYCDGQNAV